MCISGVKDNYCKKNEVSMNCLWKIVTHTDEQTQKEVYDDATELRVMEGSGGDLFLHAHDVN